MEVPTVLPFCLRVRLHVCVCCTCVYTHLTHLSHSVPYCACVVNMLMFATDRVSACVPVSCYLFVCESHAPSVGARRFADSDREAGHWVMEFVPVESASH